MGFENFKAESIKPALEVPEEEDVKVEPGETEFSPEEIAEIDRSVREQLAAQEEVHGGVMQIWGDKIRKELKEKTARGKVLVAAFGMYAASTVLAGNFSNAEAGGRDRFGSRIGRDAADAAGDVVEGIGRGIGAALEDFFKRGLDGKTPQEKAREIRDQQRLRDQIAREELRSEIRREREIIQQDRRFFREIESALRGKRTALQGGRRMRLSEKLAERDSGMKEEERMGAIRNTDEIIKEIKEVHGVLHKGEESCTLQKEGDWPSADR